MEGGGRRRSGGRSESEWREEWVSGEGGGVRMCEGEQEGRMYVHIRLVWSAEYVVHNMH